MTSIEFYSPLAQGACTWHGLIVNLFLPLFYDYYVYELNIYFFFVAFLEYEEYVNRRSLKERIVSMETQDSEEIVNLEFFREVFYGENICLFCLITLRLRHCSGESGKYKK